MTTYEGPFDTAGYDTSGYEEVATASYDASTAWTDASWDAWGAGAYDASYYAEDQAQVWTDYGQSYDQIAADPTDWSAWSDAYETAHTASWDAWDASLDAYAAGDYATAEYLESYSDDLYAQAGTTWDAWGDAWDASYYSYDSYYDSSYDAYYDTYSYDTYGTGYDTGYDSYGYDTSSYDTGYDSYAYDTSSYDTGYDSGSWDTSSDW